MIEMGSTSTSSSTSFSEIVSVESTASGDDDVPTSSTTSKPERQARRSEFTANVEKIYRILEIIRQNYKFDGNPTVHEAVFTSETELQNLGACTQSPTSNIKEVTQNLRDSLSRLLSATHSVSFELKEDIVSLQREVMDVQLHVYSDHHEDLEVKSCSNNIGVRNELEENNIMNLEDIVLQLKYGSEEDFRLALFSLQTSIVEKHICNDWVKDEGIVSVLFHRLSSSHCVERLSIIRVLRSIVLENAQSKEKMADINSLTALVKSLARETMESREAVGLLADLCQVSLVRRKIGRIKGCILMLVAILNGDNQIAANDAGNLLNSLSNNTQNALLMAEAGYFRPLIQHLKEGSEMSKILMATSLTRMKLTDQTISTLGENGAIEPLIIMFKTGKLEAKLSALTTLKNLSILKQNVSLLIRSGILPPLLQLLFSVTSSVMSLREPASALLARMAQTESVFMNKDVANQMISLLNLSSPMIQSNLLEALNSITAQPNAYKVRSQMRKNGTIQLLLPFVSECDAKIRTNALNVLRNITDNLPEDLVESLGENHIRIIVNIVASSLSATEKEAAFGLLSNIPVEDKKATDILKKENFLAILVSTMNLSSTDSVPKTTSKLEQSIASIIIRFTVPSDTKLQLFAAESGVIPVLVKLLSTGSVTSRTRAATALSQLSQNTHCTKRKKQSKWSCYLPPLGDHALCSVHRSYCTVKSNLCLIKAGAVTPLIHALEDKERGADEAILGALQTLLQGELWEDGSDLIVKMSGVEAIVNVLELGTVKTKEKALWILERIFGIEVHRMKYGELAQRVLIDLAKREDISLKPRIAKLLAQLELLQVQSSYF